VNAGVIAGIAGILFMLIPKRTAYKIPRKAYPYIAMFRSAERQYSLPFNLLVRMAQQESYFNVSATGASGEQGIMQIYPRWHPDLKNPYEPSQAIPYAAKYLKQMYNRFGRWDYAIMGYNMGPNALARWVSQGANKSKLPKITAKYIADVSKDVNV